MSPIALTNSPRLSGLTSNISDAMSMSVRTNTGTDGTCIPACGNRHGAVAIHPPREAVSDVINVGGRRDGRIRLTAVRVIRRDPSEGTEGIAPVAALAIDVRSHACSIPNGARGCGPRSRGVRRGYLQAAVQSSSRGSVTVLEGFLR